MSTLRFRLVALVTVAAAALWLPFAFTHVNSSALWLAVPFLCANLLLACGLGLALVNNWHRSVPPSYTVPAGTEPVVGVIVPTAGESPDHIGPTVESVLLQDWPEDRLVILVSDDADSAAVRAATEQIAAAHPGCRIHYHRPPSRGSAEREGEAKSGNLNSAVRRLTEIAPETEYIETRDADDLVGDAQFLRRCVGHLLRDGRTAYVQTVKEARVSPGDPFDNLQPLFFRGAMFARHAANAVFPCGSGLVWRRTALEDIGGFPTWNLVEDVQSGVEALRRGWRSAFLPIRGAVGQHSPEDLPNVYKQRGTWALDTMRLLIWGDLRGLTLRQRLQFAELGLFYLQSFATLVFVACPAIGFSTGVYPLSSGYGDYALHFWPFAIAIELYFAALAVGASYERVWRARVLWIGLAPVYMKACVLAVAGGRNRKPVYRVTRKHDEHRWYWRLVLPQMVLLAVLLGSMAKTLSSDDLLYEVDLGSLYWASIFSLTLACFIPRSWFRVGVRARLAALVARSAPEPAPADFGRAVAVVLPACDQAEVMERAIRGIQPVLHGIGRSARLLVVDRGALDGSAGVARRLARELPAISVLRCPHRLGVGRAHHAGFEAALAGGAELVVLMDADLSHDPADIVRLIEAADEADVVIGSRHVGGAESKDRQAFGRWMRRRGANYMRAQLGVEARDVTSGLVCYRAEALASLLPESTPRHGYLLKLELIAGAERAGFRVVEIPVSVGPRQAGGTERSMVNVAATAFRVWAARPAALEPPPVTAPSPPPAPSAPPPGGHGAHGARTHHPVHRPRVDRRPGPSRTGRD